VQARLDRIRPLVRQIHEAGNLRQEAPEVACNFSQGIGDARVWLRQVQRQYGYPSCGWSEDSNYDLSAGRDPVDERGGAIDQYGGYHPSGSAMALAYRLARKFEDRE
jgi:hypothetical protein